LIAAASYTEEDQKIRELARMAYIWGMPLVEAGLIRERFTSPPKNGDAPAVPLNRFKHRRTLAGPEMKVGVGPNNDTIYSLAWVDLSQGPLVISSPDFGDRYYTFSINYADTSSEQSLGQRTHGGKLPPLFLHGPDYKGPIPEGMVSVPSKTRYVNVAGRILVRSPDEYAEVNAFQDKLAIYRWSDWETGQRIPAPPGIQSMMSSGPKGSSASIAFYYRLGSLLQGWHVNAEERKIVQSFAEIGITPDQGFRPETLSARKISLLDEGFATGRSQVAEASLNLGTQQNGWTTNYRGPRFGTDWLLRAAVAKDQIYVAIPEEAVYPIGRVDADGRPLHGAKRYRIRFAADALPPVNAFWSITAYDDLGHMIPNPINRYSVGDRTAGLIREPDGSVIVTVASTPPAHGEGQNWLPVTADKPFYLMMRLYLPRADVLTKLWLPPAIVRTE